MTRSKISKRILDSTSDEVRASVQKIAGEMISVSELQIKALRDKHPGASDEEINHLLTKL